MTAPIIPEMSKWLWSIDAPPDGWQFVVNIETLELVAAIRRTADRSKQAETILLVCATFQDNERVGVIQIIENERGRSRGIWPLAWFQEGQRVRAIFHSDHVRELYSSFPATR